MKEMSFEDVHMLLTKSGDTLSLFVYTPLCGTCKAAERMLMVVEQLKPALRLYKCNLNVMPQLAEQFQIQSVPCLLVFEHGRLTRRIFAMRSVQDLLQQLP